MRVSQQVHALVGRRYTCFLPACFHDAGVLRVPGEVRAALVLRLGVYSNGLHAGMIHLVVEIALPCL